MFEDIIWKPDSSPLIPLLSWVITIFHGMLTLTIVKYTISKGSVRRTVLDTSNIAVVAVLLMRSFIASMTNTLLSVTINPGWTFAKLLGSAAFLAILLYQSELLANAIIQALVIAFPSTLYSSTFNSISKKIVKLGLPSATLLSYGLLEVYSGTNFIVTSLLGQGTLPLLEDMWTIILLLINCICSCNIISKDLSLSPKEETKSPH